ncbi:dipeptide ABC transporter ATP-binding protein [Microbacterium ulmi]|uniref:ABC transporter ATP-binding protein n=1 Tax=Microbacterium ulmi TaxID=179095 RepID=A0A7Y2Q1M7_9MICO|nr:ABC transporter ATP-binding protein [Microbacterium ulmi]NII69296.1 peptide/nickel transport system ATP-binding protein [Microbacterium ulmi]NNH04090.1 ABC transporter ATP-binding protein [Microbacterium ulmi]
MTRDDTLLRIDGLEVAYRTERGVDHALRGVSAHIRRGRVTAIIGESGSGKSTLAHTIVRLLPETAQVSAGSVEFEGEDLAALSDRELRSVRGRRIGFVPQDPIASLNPTATVGAQLRESYTLARSLKTPAEIDEEIASDLEAVGFPDPADVLRRYPHELSGGQRQRLLVSIAFSQRPSLVIADESTSALDVLVGKEVLASIHRIRERHDTTVVIITHDLALAAGNADDVLVMEKGVIVEAGEIASVFAAPGHRYTRELLASSARVDGGRTRSIPQLYAAHRAPVEAPPAAENALEIRGLAKRFARGDGRSVAAVDDVSIDVAVGSTFALVGESGSGKTTTSRIILGLERPDKGRVSVFGHDVHGLSRGALRDLRREMQPVYQSPFESLDPSMSLASIIAEPLHAYRIGTRRERAARVEELLDLVRLPSSYAKRRPAELSGGQRQRVAIARALALRPKLLVLDEPVSALDATIQTQVLDLLREVQGELSLTYFLVTHDLSVVVDLAQSVGVMQRGRLVEYGPAGRVILSPQHDYTRALLAA